MKKRWKKGLEKLVVESVGSNIHLLWLWHCKRKVFQMISLCFSFFFIHVYLRKTSFENIKMECSYSNENDELVCQWQVSFVVEERAREREKE